MSGTTSNIVILGPPGSGKGTQAVLLAEQLVKKHLSTGDALRREIAEGSELGKAAQSYMESGSLVPDELVVGIVEDTIKRHEDSGVILDGFPRTIAQAEMLERHGYKLCGVLYLMVPDEEIVRRLSNRRYCARCKRVVFGENDLCDVCQSPTEMRSDDDAEIVKKRLDVYKESTAPLIAFYQQRNLLMEVDGVGSIEQINHRLLGVLAKQGNSSLDDAGCCR